MHADTFVKAEREQQDVPPQSAQQEAVLAQSNSKIGISGLSDLQTKLHIAPGIPVNVQLNLDHPGRRLYFQGELLQNTDNTEPLDGDGKPWHRGYVFVLDNYLVFGEPSTGAYTKGVIQYRVSSFVSQTM